MEERKKYHGVYPVAVSRILDSNVLYAMECFREGLVNKVLFCERIDHLWRMVMCIIRIHHQLEILSEAKILKYKKTLHEFEVEVKLGVNIRLRNFVDEFGNYSIVMSFPLLNDDCKIMNLYEVKALIICIRTIIDFSEPCMTSYKNSLIKQTARYPVTVHCYSKMNCSHVVDIRSVCPRKCSDFAECLERICSTSLFTDLSNRVDSFFFSH